MVYPKHSKKGMKSDYMHKDTYSKPKKMSYKSQGKGKMMDNGVGIYSYKSNPMKMANQVTPMAGPGWNPDQQKANKLLHEAYYEEDSLRGKSGM